MTSPPPKGLIVALVTPFDEKGGLDRDSLRRLIERTLPFCDGLLVGESQFGEGLSLPNPLRLELLRSSLKIVAGKKPLLLCPTGRTAEETLSNVTVLSREAATPAEENLFWIDIPLWYHSNRKLPQYYQEWANDTPFSILLYNHPQLIARLNQSLKRNNIRTSVLKRLAENEQIVGLVQAGDLKRTLHYQRAVRARRDFRFYDGDERNFLASPSSSGVVSGGANLLPSEWREIVASSLRISEDPARSLLLLKQSQKVRDLAQALQKNPAWNLKVALQSVGLISRAEVLGETQTRSAEEGSEIAHFLQANFSLHPPR
jgi:dihydrodipicolinate synthase/N-acetylneuraminate lyase